MTPQKVKEYLPIFEAYANGKVIEYRKTESEIWLVVEDLNYLGASQLGMDGFQFRIKPKEPREFWANIYPSCQDIRSNLWGSKKEAIEHQAQGVIETIKVREVINDN